jgi:diacylglycerol kinase family enzyme
LGILPLGTSNDTARSLGIPLDLRAAAQVIAQDNAQPFDAGQALPALAATPTPAGTILSADDVASEEAGAPGLGAYFLHALTLGFNVRFARLATNIARRERLGGWNYAASLLEAIATFRPVEVTLRFAGLTEPADLGTDAVVSGPVLEVAAVNLPRFAGGMNLRVPAVKPHDQLLDFVVFEALEPRGLRMMIEDAVVALGRLPDEIRASADHKGSGAAQADDSESGLALPGIRRYKARQAVIESAQPQAVTLDGEVRAKTPVLVRVAPQPTHIFVPRRVGAGAQ